MESTLIISGGGNRGSWGARFSKGLVESGKEYQIVGGTSAGALITSSVILNQFKKLETLFNRINNRDVYNVNPFRSNGGIRVFKSLLRTLFGYSSIGESKNLRKLIEEIFTEEDYKNYVETIVTIPEAFLKSKIHFTLINLLVAFKKIMYAFLESLNKVLIPLSRGLLLKISNITSFFANFCMDFRNFFSAYISSPSTGAYITTYQTNELTEN